MFKVSNNMKHMERKSHQWYLVMKWSTGEDYNLWSLMDCYIFDLCMLCYVYHPGWTLRWITLLASASNYSAREMNYSCRWTQSSLFETVHSCWLEHVAAERGGLRQLAPLFSVIGRFDIWRCRKQPDYLQDPPSLLLNKDGHVIILWWNILWCSDVSLIETASFFFYTLAECNAFKSNMNWSVRQ